MSYKRVVLKISGEQLAGEHDSGIDPKVAHFLASELKSIAEDGCQVVVIVGGGNMVRGAKVAGHGIQRVTADQMGMLSGLINAMALTDIFESQGVPTRCLSNIFADQVAEPYSFRLAEKHLEMGRVVLVAGGTGRPYFTHDTAAVSMALELNCQIVLKATKVEGVFTKDPAKHTDAKKIDHMTLREAVENKEVAVMDKSALALALDHNIPLIVFDVLKPGNLKKAINKRAVGTRID